MKLNRLVIQNIGIIESETVTLDKPLILFYGEIRQGKTTILNAVKWALGAPFPADLIRHGEKEASACLEFDGGSVSRSWYRNKAGKVTARSVELIKNGKLQDRPMDQLRAFLNPFMLDQDHLRNMGGPERNRFFVELFNVDTEEIDTELLKNEKEAKELRIAIKAVGDIVLEPVELIDVAAVKAEKASIEEAFNKQMRNWQEEINKKDADHSTELKRIAAANGAIHKANAAIDSRIEEIESLKKTLAGLEALPTEKGTLIPIPEPPDHSVLRQKLGTQPDTSALQAQLNDAAAIDVKFQQYQKDKARAEARDADVNKLANFADRRKVLVDQKTSRLKELSDSTGIEGLEFNSSGELTYQNTESGMLSTSQVMELSSALANLYPDGLGIELLDRGESLGTSIFKVIDRAKKEGKTILASIVGEKPSETIDGIGVFVVEAGKIQGNEKPSVPDENPPEGERTLL